MRAKLPHHLAAFLIGGNGAIKSWNAECEQLLGHRAIDALDERVAVLLAPAEHSAALLRSLSAEPQDTQLELRHADGTRSCFEIRLLPQNNGQGQRDFVVLLVPVPAPVSERQLIGSLELESLLSLGSNNFCVVNSSGRMVLWNKQIEQTTQFTGGELSAACVTDMFPEQQRAAVQQRINEALGQDAELLLECDLLAKDGHTTPHLFAINRFQLENQYYIFCLGMDVTARRRDEETLRLRERALHATSNGVVITRCAGGNNPIEYVNPAFEKITGYSAAEAIGNDSRFMAAPGLDEAERAQLRAAIAAEREINVVFRNLRKNGELFWNDLTVTPVRNEREQVTHFIGVINDVTALKQRTSLLEHEVNHDPLTGLANRNLLWDRLEQALHAAHRNKTLVAVVLVDLNKFKQINDTLGHEAGDEVLRLVGRRLQAAVRDCDTVARLSGDEFVLVLTEQPSLRFTLRMIERLRSGLLRPLLFDSKDVTVGAAMGVSIYPHDGTSAIDLVRAADAAMYEAKGDGMLDVRFFSAEMRSSTEAKQKLETDMRNAVANNEVFLVYQPRWSLRTGRVVGVEALLRWRHPELGVLMPTAFLADAEESGLIVPMGLWVVDHACAMLARLSRLGRQDLPLSFNASYREFIQDDFLTNIRTALRRHGVSPSNFEVELREEHLMRNPHLSSGVATACRSLGIRLSIDDFGAGASNLTYLQSLPISQLKMTRSSVNEICDRARSGRLAKTLIDIGHNMGVEIVGAGVESDLQRGFLEKARCDQAQGHFLCPPLNGTSLEELLHENPTFATCRRRDDMQ
jgi:diguanylate cyclase (GGDEF)-like protein/PAS domain S-box-containing protein